MIHIYTSPTLSEASKLNPEDLFSGDGNTKDFALVYVTSALLARVYVDETLKGTVTDFYTYLASGTGYIHFYTAPILGTNNIVLQTDDCIFFPGGSAFSGALNAYGGESCDTQLWLSNDDSDKAYNGVTLDPIDFIGDDEAGWIKLATTQGGLDSAVAGATLAYGNITDYDTAHAIWARCTVPEGFLPPNNPALNKYDVCFNLGGAEYDV